MYGMQRDHFLHFVLFHNARSPVLLAMAPFLKFITLVATPFLLLSLAQAQSTPDANALASSILSAAGNAVPTPTTVVVPAASAASSGGCPAIWSTVAKDLKAQMGGCNELARSAIRFAFHDAGESYIPKGTNSPCAAY